MNLKRIRTTLLLTAAAALVLGLLTASLPAHAAIGSDTPIPAAPSNLKAKATGMTSVKLTWTNNATSQSGVVISLDGVTSVDVPGATVSSYTWKGLSPGTRYWFYVASKIYGTPGDPTGPGNTQSAWVGPAYATTATSSSAPCDFTSSLKTCKSTDPTASYTSNATGDTSHCTFVFKIKWGDGGTTTKTVTDPTDGHHVIGKHTYAAGGVYPIAVNVRTTAGTCTATSSSHTFTLLAPSPVFNKIYSGYLTPFAAKYQDVNATWHIPALDCAASAKISGASQWIGLGGVTIGKQVSTPLVQVGIISGCVAGLQVNVPFWQVVPGNNAQLLAHLPSSGDEIVATVDYLGKGKYLVGIKDSTANWIDGGKVPFTVSGKVPTSAEWIVEPGDLIQGKKSTTASLADFGQVTFKGASYSTTTSNGVTLGGRSSVTPIVLEQTTGGTPKGPQWTTVSNISPPGEFTTTYIPGGLG
jgi:hypothetical protein